MKKLLFLLAFCVPVILTARVSVAPVAGINFNHYGFKYLSKDLGSINQLGIKAGALVDIPLSEHLCLQPGAYYFVNCWSSWEIQAFPDVRISNVNMPTIETAINLTHKMNVRGNNRSFLSVGPYAAVFLRGMAKSTVEFTDPTGYKHVLKVPLIPFKRTLDYGVNIHAGYELKNGVFAKLHGQFGLRNLNDSYYEDMSRYRPYHERGNSTVFSSSYGLSVGYLIGKKDKKPITPPEQAQ
jgi:hypothetical protein